MSIRSKSPQRDYINNMQTITTITIMLTSKHRMMVTMMLLLLSCSPPTSNATSIRSRSRECEAEHRRPHRSSHRRNRRRHRLRCVTSIRFSSTSRVSVNRRCRRPLRRRQSWANAMFATSSIRLLVISIQVLCFVCFLSASLTLYFNNQFQLQLHQRYQLLHHQQQRRHMDLWVTSIRSILLVNRAVFRQ